ncbi:MAG: hypothetical protein JSW52_07710 [Candidatus Coatesbacteria bacterium]|nr:MAG: hypothetical protein JSW52_07710 [Candidatus Coatesbacteria bacterium]
MIVHIPRMEQDPMMMARYKGVKTVRVTINEEFFLDGPVTKRIAVLDFDADTGELKPGAKFRPPKPGRKIGTYAIEDETNVHARDFRQVNAFAIVYGTLNMLAKPHTLGRQLTWAFDGPQLLVVPNAGEWENAYYERDSHSLQLFYFRDPRYPDEPDKTIYTCLSTDIIAHETGHAILDGIAPDLNDAITPQSLALHEAFADLTALWMAFEHRQLRKAVLDRTDGSIEDSSEFTAIAEEFGTVLKKMYDPGEEIGALRDINNKKNLIPGADDYVADIEPHALSQVLSGALYAVMVKIHNGLVDEYSGGDPNKRKSVSGKALAVGAARFKRMLFRALDYLPPGEISFADYGRAIIAHDQAHYPDDGQVREWIKDEFVKRGIVRNRDALEVKTNFEEPALENVNVEMLINSDWAAYQFANENRKLLHIPSRPRRIPFEVRPRHDVLKLYYYGPKEFEKRRECILKVSWDEIEPNRLGPRYPDRRRITVGTTLVIKMKKNEYTDEENTNTVRALLTSYHKKLRPEELKEQRAARDEMLQRLVDMGLLYPEKHVTGPDGKPLRSVVHAECARGPMHVRGTARTIHIAKEL